MARPRTVTRYRPAVYDSAISAEFMWAVAAHIDRVSGGYVKFPERDSDTGQVLRPRSLDLMRDEIRAGLVNVTAEDFELGRQAKDWHQGRLTFKLLRSHPLSEFEKTLLVILGQEEFASRRDGLEMSILASQISAYRRGLELEQMTANVDPGPVAEVGQRVQLEATVVRSIFSFQYNVFFITVYTSCNHIVFFSYREQLGEKQKISLTGTVKAHRPDSTQLNRVKVI